MSCHPTLWKAFDGAFFQGAQVPELGRVGQGAVVPDRENAFERYAQNTTAPFVCYASKPNSFIIRSSGDIGKCTVVLRDPRNRLGRINPDGTMEVDPTLLTLWMQGFQSLDLETLACPAEKLPRLLTIEPPPAPSKREGEKLRGVG